MLGPNDPRRMGRYEILDVLGRGAMGVVYLARDPLIGRRVAIKTFRMVFGPEEPESREFRARFIREAQSAGILSHPHIVTVHDVVDESSEGTFIAMEFVEGENLKARLQSGELFSTRRVIGIVEQVAAGLDYAHAQGVIHRDIKPANILLDRAGNAKITDFGIARLDTSDLTQEGQLLGTPNYMAPERILGREVDHRTDIFSLGVVAYELLARQKPFRGENLTMVTHRIVHEEVTPVSEIASVPGSLDPVLARAMAKEPADRYASAGEMARALREAIEAEVGEDTAVDAPPAPSGPESVEENEAATRDVAVGLPPPPLPPSAPPPGAVSAATPPAPKATAMPAKPGSGAAHLPARRRWPAAAIAVLALLAIGSVIVWTVLASDRDETEAVAAPAATVVPQAAPLRVAHAALGAGDLEAAATALAQAQRLAPGDPEVEALARELALRRDEAQLRDERAAQVAGLLEEAESALAARRWDAAIEAADRLLAVDPAHERATALRAEAEDGKRRARRPAAPAPPPRQAQVAPAAEPAPPAAEPAPEPATFRLHLVFLSEPSEGTVTVYANGEQVLREGYDFRRRVGILRTAESAGRIDATVELPRGATELKILAAAKGEAAKLARVQESFRGGTEPTLRVVFRKSGELTAAVE